MKSLYYLLYISLLFCGSCNTSQKEDLNLKHVNHIANSINNDLLLIKNKLASDANTIQHRIKFDEEVQDFSKETYVYSPSGILLSKYSELKSAIYYPSGKTNIHNLKKIIINTEALDSLFLNTINNLPQLSQIYFLDTNSFMRIYPYVKVENYINSNFDLRTFIPYQTANNKPFINEKAYWVNKPFVDPYGRGWIISCVEPIYYRDQFVGILSGDITLQSFKNKYLSSGTEMFMLIDQKGKVICCTKEAGKLTNIPQLREFRYYKPITEDVFDSNCPTLTEHKNKSLSKAIKSLLSGKTIENFYIDNNKYTIYKSLIKETDWFLLKIIN